MTHYLTRDIWLQQRDERTLASNIRTGRRALLNSDELEILDSFAQSEVMDERNETHQRLADADLIQTSCRPESPRATTLTNVLERHLLREHGMRKKKIREEFSDDIQKLALLEEYLVETVSKDAYLPHVLTRDLNAMLDHVRTFLTCESNLEESGFRFRKGFAKDTAGRPLPREDYEQQPCMPETSQRRVEMGQKLLGPCSRGLILGDDDLLSVYWSRHIPQPCDVFELDQDLIEFLSPRLSPQVSLKSRDLTLGLPREFRGLYDLVFTDPMYEESGMDLFMKCCAEALSDNPDARVLFTTRIDMIDAGDRFEERLAQVGLEIEETMKDFSRYRLPDFYRRKLVKGFCAHGISPQLVQGLTQIPYLYADLFRLKKI
jgi:branched-chain polyamine synthase A-like protein